MLRGLLSLSTRSPRPLGVTAMLLAAIVAAPSDAEATCGDYLWMPEHALGQAHDRADVTPESDDQPLPCRGPECSRAPQAPLAPVPPPVTLDTHEQGVLAAIQQASGRNDLTWAVRDTAPRPVMFGSSIFRPPR